MPTKFVYAVQHSNGDRTYVVAESLTEGLSYFESIPSRSAKLMQIEELGPAVVLNRDRSDPPEPTS